MLGMVSVVGVFTTDCYQNRPTAVWHFGLGWFTYRMHPSRFARDLILKKKCLSHPGPYAPQGSRKLRK